MKSNERGFASVLVIIILVLLLGIIGLYFFLQTKDDKPALKQTVSQTSPSPTTVQEISPIPTSEASPPPAGGPTQAAPVVVFAAAGSFSDSEEEQIRQRVVNPFIAFHQDIEGQADIVSITISHSSTLLENHPYGADAVFAHGAMSSFLIRTTDGVVDWWLPDCMGVCQFSESFRATYPEIVSQFE